MESVEISFPNKYLHKSLVNRRIEGEKTPTKFQVTGERVQRGQLNKLRHLNGYMRTYTPTTYADV